MVQNLDLRVFFYFKWFKGYSGLNVMTFYFQSYRNAKKKKLYALNVNNRKCEKKKDVSTCKAFVRKVYTLES